MKRILTVFLRAAILGMALGSVTVCTVLLPSIWSDIATEYSGYTYAVYAVVAAVFIATVPFFVGLYGAWKLLDHIDKGRAFSHESARAIRLIAIAAGIVSMLYILSLPLVYIWAENDDAPGLLLVGMTLVAGPLVIAVFALLLHRLVSEATSIKTENELTV
jgi:hypothetical protein